MATSSATNQGRFRLSLFAAFFCFWILMICGRLVWLQIGDYGFLRPGIRQDELAEPTAPAIYQPYLQVPDSRSWMLSDMSFVARTSGAAAGGARRLVASEAREPAVARLVGMGQHPPVHAPA